MDAAFLNKYRVSIKDLNYSIQSTSASMATLSMSFEIILGATKEEIETGKYPTHEAMGEFQKTVEALDPDIKDQLQSTIGNMTMQQIQKPDGQDYIKQQVKNYINERLDRIKYSDVVSEDVDKKRVTRVNITSFILQR